MNLPERQPFSVRLGHNAPYDEAPYEGVPRHLESALRAWVSGHFSDGSDDDAVELALRLRFVPRPGESDRGTLLRTDGMELLDVVDALLSWEGDASDYMGGDSDGQLTRILDSAGSAYRVNKAQDALEWRIIPAAREPVMETIEEASVSSSAGDHLAAAWQAAYGVHPDSVRAYSEAIKAVECAAHPVLQPNHPGATLGSMLGEIKNIRAKLSFVIPDSAGGEPIGVVETMMRALWRGQTARHGAKTPTVPETLESARAGVHLAAALVQWFVSGAVTRTP
ncbi:hypothetical protein [Streptomyces sp. RKAG293]|uniref:hypothetical protein n=1 Tax=Streptomyces sp. RKAG293 TaxID=2893403 RepID=UPI0020342FA5|nr:hypothetical protein [Streptomyces sp. RKAG293]MCM2424291.1 hypothetical protein [Streptomyces sp. RKAG293]